MGAMSDVEAVVEAGVEAGEVVERQ